jgi:outer membrane protein assembly factor BamB
MIFLVLLIIFSGCSQDKEKIKGKRQEILSQDLPDKAEVKIYPPKKTKQYSLKTVFEYKTSQPLEPGILPCVFAHQEHLYVLSPNNTIVSLNSKGKEVWEKEFLQTNDSIGMHICSDHHVVYALCFDGMISAFTKTSNFSKKQLWSRDSGFVIRSQPLLDERLLFVFGERVLALDKKNGSILWEIPLHLEKNTFTSCLTATQDDDKIFILSKTLQACHKANGQILWEKKLDDAFAQTTKHPPIISDEALFVLTYKGNLLKLDKNNGQLIWKKNLKITSSIFAEGRFVFVIVNNNSLYCLDKESGKINWKHDLSQDTSWMGVASYQNALITFSQDGDIFWINSLDGTKIKETSVAMSFSQMPIVWRDKIVFVNDDGRISVKQ